jgi:hypothetical protein
MPASRVELEPKTEPKRWETLGDDYKADLTAHPEEIKDLCPIVITTIDCRATRFKDADGNVLTVTSRSKDGVVLTVKVTSRLEVKDGKERRVEVKDGEERTIKQVKTHTATQGPDRYEDVENGDPVEAMDFEFDRTIQGNPEDDDAHFFTDVGVARKEGSWFSHNVFEGRDIVGGGIATTIDKVAKDKFGGATHCML